MSLTTSSASSQPPAKKARTEPRLAVHPGQKNFANLKIQDVENLSPEVRPIQYLYLEANSLFQSFRPEFTDLQERFWSLRKHRLAHCTSWLEQNVTSANRKVYKLTAKKLVCFLRTYADVREAAHGVRNFLVAQTAAAYEACAAASLVSTSCMTPEVLDEIPDIRNRFDAALTYMEVEVPKQPVNVTVASRSNASTQTTAANPTIATSLATTNQEVQSTQGGLQLDHRSDEYLRQRIDSFRVNLADRKVIPWNCICGSDEIKGELDVMVAAMLYADKIAVTYEHFSGVLLFGPNGTGKSSLVMSFAAHYNLPLYSISGDIKGSLQGETEKMLKLLFAEVQAKQPCVLLFDEADGLIRDSSRDTSLASLTSSLKTEWSNLIENQAKVFIFGASNQPWDIPSAGFSRRFDRLVLMGLPDTKAREELLKTAFKDNQILSEGQMKKLADMTDGYTGWDIHRAVKTVQQELIAEVVSAQAWKKVQTDQGERLLPAPLKPGDQPVRLADVQLSGSALVSPRPLTFDMLRQLFDPESNKYRRKTVDAATVEQHKRWAAAAGGVLGKQS